MKKIMTKRNIFWVTYFTFFILLGTPTYVWAYVDPATLTYVIQIVAGVFIAGGVVVGVYWRKIKKTFKKDKTAEVKNATGDVDRSAAAAAAEAEEEK